MFKNEFEEVKIFAQRKLALHLSVPIDREFLEGKINGTGKTYSLKVSSPVTKSKKTNLLLWDFDLRASRWQDGRSIKSRKEKHQSDYYLLFGLNEDRSPGKVYLLPAAEIKASHIRISYAGDSKYSGFQI